MGVRDVRSSQTLEVVRAVVVVLARVVEEQPGDLVVRGGELSRAFEPVGQAVERLVVAVNGVGDCVVEDTDDRAVRREAELVKDRAAQE